MLFLTGYNSVLKSRSPPNQIQTPIWTERQSAWTRNSFLKRQLATNTAKELLKAAQLHFSPQRCNQMQPDQ